MTYEFSGYATKHNLKCSDGRTILPDAFKTNDGSIVPLVWQHKHDDPENVLGHALLENRKDGVYAYCSLNNSEKANVVRELLSHKDVKHLSIYANKLVQRGNDVMHGVIREVSVVLAGANPGAFIDNIHIQHDDGFEVIDDEAVIYTGLTLQHEEPKEREENVTGTAENSEKTVKDIFDTLTEEQKTVVYFMVGQALESAAEEDDEVEETEEAIQQDAMGGIVTNVFENYGENTTNDQVLTHSQIQNIFEDAERFGSLKESFLMHAQDYGIENIDILFPDAQTLQNSPEFISRRMEWVSDVLGSTKHSPFSRIKSIAADITADEARARGYAKGNLKKEEIIKLLRRITTPTTIYKKQKLDRDDILDITDLDVVAWLKAEMRIMLDEELARAILIGDGRDAASDDKIDEERIRPIWTDDDMYSHKVTLDANVTPMAMVEALIRARKAYKGSGNPTFYTNTDVVTDMLLIKDKNDNYVYNTEAELLSKLRVKKIVEVEVMEGATRTDDDLGQLDLVGIMVNLADYVVGADKGGSVSMFDDFDIDYNQYKYLLETRCSGTLVLPKSALVIEKKVATTP